MSCNDTPCSTGLSTTESMASQIGNLIDELFGTFTKTIVNGRAVWSAVCSPNDTGLACYPRADGEGWICYIIRVLDAIGVFSPVVWSSLNSYCKNTMVATSTALYVSILAVPAGIDISNGTYWRLLITPPAGPAGATGPAGAAGGGSAISYSERVVTISDTALNTDAVVFCEGAGGITITLSAMAAYSGGKWFVINNDTSGTVTITPTTQTINGAASYVLTVAKESVTIVARNSTDWKIV